MKLSMSNADASTGVAIGRRSSTNGSWTLEMHATAEANIETSRIDAK